MGLPAFVLGLLLGGSVPNGTMLVDARPGKHGGHGVLSVLGYFYDG